MQTFNEVKRGAFFFLIAVMVLGCVTTLPAQTGEPAGATPEEEIGYFYMRERPNYAGAQWVYDDRTHKLIGYAPWDPIQRRWTLFSLDGKYKGFIQATIGDDGFEYFRREKEFRNDLQYGVPNEVPPRFTQYLWYDSHNKYRGILAKRLGGRPASVRLPDGELGGQLDYFRRGRIQSEAPLYEKQVHPLKRMMEGIEVTPIDPMYKDRP